MMGAFLEVARTGLASALLHPTRSLVTAACLMAVLLPYLVALGLSRGLHDHAETSLRMGADLYLTGRRFGRPAPVPVSMVADLRKVPGVVRVVPRIVGGLVLGKDDEPAVVVGLPPDSFPEAARSVQGRLPADGGPNEVVVGTALARRLRIEVGSMLPPFYRNAAGERLSRVVGRFTPDAGPWQANLLFTTYRTAAHLFDQEGLATDLLVWCRPGAHEQVTAALLGVRPAERGLRLAITARSDAEALARAGLTHREGVVSLHFIVAFTVGILAVLVTSGLGLSDRRREIAILKATGWQTDQVLLRGSVESLLIAVAATSASVVLAYGWLKGLNGYGIASVFLPGVEASPTYRVPFRLMPVPVLLAFVIGLVVVMTGTLYSSWRAAVAPPSEAMR